MKITFYIKTVMVVMGVLSVMSVFAANTVQAFGLSTNPFTGNVNGINPCYVDIAQTQSRWLNQRINEQPENQLSQWVQQYGNTFTAISHSYVCAAQAKIMGITKLPAVVFNHQYVIYGVNNLLKAQQIFAHYQEHHDG